MGSHLTATGRHLPWDHTVLPASLLPDTNERTPPIAKRKRYVNKWRAVAAQTARRSSKELSIDVYYFRAYQMHWSGRQIIR